MPEKKKLRDALSDLRTRLDEGEAIDAESRSMLVDLHDRIEATLDLTGESAPVERAVVHEQADTSAQGFAARYPQVSAILERITETLLSIGL